MMLTPSEEARKAELEAEIKTLEANARERHLKQQSERIYSFSEIANTEYLNDIKRFQITFGRHIKDLLHSEHLTIILYEKLLSGIFGNPIDTVDTSEIDDVFKRLRKSIQIISQHPTGYWQRMLWKVINVRDANFKGETENDQIGYYANKIFDFILEIEQIKDEGLLPKVLDQYETWAREAIDETPAKKNINWLAVNAVSRLRVYWESWAEIPAPRRALNPTSPFAEYLRDAFEFFEIKGNPDAAFKRWAALSEDDEV